MAPNGSGRIAARSSRRQGRSRSKAVVTWGARSVDTAHAVDRDLLDQKLVGGERLGLVVVCGGRHNGYGFVHEHLLRYGTGCHRNGIKGQRSRLLGGTRRRIAPERPAGSAGWWRNDVSGGGAGRPARRGRTARAPAGDLPGRTGARR